MTALRSPPKVHSATVMFASPKTQDLLSYNNPLVSFIFTEKEGLLFYFKSDEGRPNPLNANPVSYIEMMIQPVDYG